MAQTTKQALARALKKRAKHKSLDKITIVDIAEDCGVNRQTFYYHFHDIVDLVEWIFTREKIKAIDGKKMDESWQNGFLRAFTYVLENRAFIENVYHSSCKEYLERYLYKETYHLLLDVVNEKAEGMSVREEDKQFIAYFYQFAFVGLLLDWIDGGMKEEPKNIIDHVSILVQGDITKALERYRIDKII